MTGGLKIETDQPHDHARLIFAEGRVNEALHQAKVAKRRAALAAVMSAIALAVALVALWRG